MFFFCYFPADGSKGTGIQSSQPHPREKFLVTETPFKLSLRYNLSYKTKMRDDKCTTI